jgi:hypothetical protein
MAGSRSEVPSLATPGDLEGFPEHALSPEVVLWRIARAGRSPWWFGSSLEGRFDLPEPAGTCYLAAEALGALLEVIGPERRGGLLARTFFEGRVLFGLRVPEGRRLADLTARTGVGYGLTLEIHSLVPYTLPQAWAVALDGQGFDGLRYRARHDPGGGFAFALFGEHGVAPWPVDLEQAIGNALLQQLEESCGLRVLEVPRYDQLRLVDS